MRGAQATEGELMQTVDVHGRETTVGELIKQLPNREAYVTVEQALQELGRGAIIVEAGDSSLLDRLGIAQGDMVALGPIICPDDGIVKGDFVGVLYREEGGHIIKHALGRLQKNLDGESVKLESSLPELRRTPTLFNAGQVLVVSPITYTERGVVDTCPIGRNLNPWT